MSGPGAADCGLITGTQDSIAIKDISSVGNVLRRGDAELVEMQPSYLRKLSSCKPQTPQISERSLCQYRNL